MKRQNAPSGGDSQCYLHIRSILGLFTKQN
jgi:hypothetical protein